MYETRTPIDAEVFSQLTGYHFSASDINNMRDLIYNELNGAPEVVTPHQFVTSFFNAFPMQKLPQVQRCVKRHPRCLHSASHMFWSSVLLQTRRVLHGSLVRGLRLRVFPTEQHRPGGWHLLVPADEHRTLRLE